MMNDVILPQIFVTTTFINFSEVNFFPKICLRPRLLINLRQLQIGVSIGIPLIRFGPKTLIILIKLQVRVYLLGYSNGMLLRTYQVLHLMDLGLAFGG